MRTLQVAAILTCLLPSSAPWIPTTNLLAYAPFSHGHSLTDS
jgi:hypothetical protein